MKLHVYGKYCLNRWVIASIVIMMIIISPILLMLTNLFSWHSKIWENLTYMENTFVLVSAVGGITLLVGVSTAFLVTFYQFPGRKFFAFALVLPLAIPSYILAFTYIEALGYAGTIDNIFGRGTVARTLFDLGIDKDTNSIFRSLGGAIFYLSCTLYPYVYLTARSSFIKQSGRLHELSRLCGHSSLRIFRHNISFIRPAIIAGVTLVCLETLGDYGTVVHCDVKTFTTEIIQLYKNSTANPENIDIAMSLSGLLFFVVLIFLMIEILQRGRAKYYVPSAESKPMTPYRTSKIKGLLMMVFCAIPVFLGFILPLIELLILASHHYQEFFEIETEFITTILWSFGLSAFTAMLLTCISIAIVFSLKIRPLSSLKALSKFATLGYAIPGALIAMCLLNFGVLFGSIADWAKTGSLFLLVFSYLVRFLTVSFNPIQSGFEKIHNPFQEARMLGIKPYKALFLVDIPLLKPAISAALILAFIDLIKELPITFILKPNYISTLAVMTFEYGKQYESISKASIPALFLIAISTTLIFVLNFLITGDHNEHIRRKKSV